MPFSRALGWSERKQDRPGFELIPPIPFSMTITVSLKESWRYHHHHHHHRVVPSARLSMTLSRHPSLSSIASVRSSRLHPVSAQNWCMSVLAGRPDFARPCEGVHRSTSLMSSSLRLQQCPTCLVHLTGIVFVMGGRWPYSCCFVGCCLKIILMIGWSHIFNNIQKATTKKSKQNPTTNKQKYCKKNK